jgi:hypothetical protein
VTLRAPGNALGSTVHGRGARRQRVVIAALVCTFAFSADVFGKGFWFLFVAGFLIVLGCLREIPRIPVHSELIMLALFAAAYSVATSGKLTDVLVALTFPVGYLVGLLVVQTAEARNVQLRSLILALVAGMTTHGVLNAVTNFLNFGWHPVERSLPDFWSGAVLSATVQGTLFIPLVGFAYYGLAIRQGNRMIPVLTAACLLVAAVYNFITASRTIFVVGLITLGVCAVSSLWLRPTRHRKSVMMVVLGGLLIVTTAYQLNLFQLRSMVDESPLISRLTAPDSSTLAEDARFTRWAYVLGHFWDHTTGGLYFRASIGYVHNLWLDAYDTAGLFALLMLGGFTIGAVALLWRVVRKGELLAELRVLLVGLWIAFLAQFMTEPILDSMPTLFVVFCVLVGGVSSLRSEAVLHEHVSI